MNIQKEDVLNMAAELKMPTPTQEQVVEIVEEFNSIESLDDVWWAVLEDILYTHLNPL